MSSGVVDRCDEGRDPLYTKRQEYDPARLVVTDAADVFQVGFAFLAQAMRLVKAGQLHAACAMIERQQAVWPGLGAEQSADSPVPRLCSELSDTDRFIACFVKLATGLGAENLITGEMISADAMFCCALSP